MHVGDQDVPYMTVEWKGTIRDRRKAARRYHKTNSIEDWESLRKLRNEATRLLRKAIRNYWRRTTELL